MTCEPQKSVKTQLLSGMRRAFPIVLGYLPVGFAYGVLASKTGISSVNAILMSVLVFAGSGQFIAVGMLAASTGATAIIATTFIVNLRHLLMSASLAPAMTRWSKKQLALFSYQITDETFAMNSAQQQILNSCKTEVFALNMTSQLSWVAGSALGVFASELIADIKPLGLDFALAGMFIGLLVFQVDSLVKLVTALCAGVIGTLLFAWGFQQFYIILATVVAATFGLLVEQWIRR